jgi:hypothetical protein
MWRTIAKFPSTDGGVDLVYFPKQQLRWLAIELSGAGEVREVQLKGGDKAWTPARQFESWQSVMPAGALPRWLKREQTFWTITGVPVDSEESLVGEDGTVEPFAGSFCVMPFLQVNGKVLTADDFRSSHSLEAGCLPLPTVTWSGHGVRLRITALSSGEAQASTTSVRYRIENPGRETAAVSLALAVRPLQLNPPWQYGGASPIRQAQFAGRELRVNSRPALLALTPPSAVAVAGRESGDVFGWFAGGTLPESREASDADGLVSALLRFDVRVPAGGERDVVVVFPLHAESPLPVTVRDGAGYFRQRYAEQTRAWSTRLGGWQIECPVPNLDKIIRANLAYMLLNRDYAAPQPGPRNYAHAWMRDGSVSTATLLEFGFKREVREYLEWFAPLVRADGFVPFLVESKTGEMPGFARDWKEYDSQGEYVYAVWEYYRHTRCRISQARLPGGAPGAFVFDGAD